MNQSSSSSRLASLSGYADVRVGIVDIVNTARVTAARNVNALMTASYWEIGRRIVEAEQNGKRRAGYGERLITLLSADLTLQFGRGFSSRNLEQMRQFYLTWPIPQTLSAESLELLPSGRAKKALVEPAQLEISDVADAQSYTHGLAELAQIFTLPWSAYVRLLSIKDAHARQFYEAEALRGGWSVRQLDRQIGSQFYE